jgi:hypothetical protein
MFGLLLVEPANARQCGGRRLFPQARRDQKSLAPISATSIAKQLLLL